MWGRVFDPSGRSGCIGPQGFLSLPSRLVPLLNSPTAGCPILAALFAARVGILTVILKARVVCATEGPVHSCRISVDLEFPEVRGPKSASPLCNPPPLRCTPDHPGAANAGKGNSGTAAPTPVRVAESCGDGSLTRPGGPAVSGRSAVEPKPANPPTNLPDRKPPLSVKAGAPKERKIAARS